MDKSTSANYFNSCSLPIEAEEDCRGLIYIIGLEPNCGEIDSLIWQCLINQIKSADQLSLAYKLVQLQHFQLPPVKEKRNSYEWYTPKGILKCNWMNKYLYAVPALISVFFRLERVDYDCENKLEELVTLVSTLRKEIGGRSTRVAVVLIQENFTDSSTTANSSSDCLSSEQATRLCSLCNIAQKHLFVLPSSDKSLVPGYVSRLEAAFIDIADDFYMAQLKVVRSHRDHLNRTSHQLLFVRHSFKIGFLSELRHDLQGALKAYLQSYQLVSDLRYTDTNLHEIRQVAAIINYKVCKMSFVLNLPRDAIAHFRRHIDVFRQRSGQKELLFEHYAWLSLQYELFGKLFESAVVQGLPAAQTQHPGFYYQQAAQFSALRRHSIQIVHESNVQYSNGWSALEYVGQRPWRAGKHSLEPPEPESEASAIQALQHKEWTTVNHAYIVAMLYSKAVSQFHRYKCPRIEQQLMVNMATEYYNSGDYKKALTALLYVLSHHRKERWWTLISGYCSLLLKCTFMETDVTLFIMSALEIMSANILLQPSAKLEVFESGVLHVLKDIPPVVNGAEVNEKISSAWRASLDKIKGKSLVVDISSISSCLEVQASFSSSVVAECCETAVNVTLRNSFVESLTVSNVTVHVSEMLHSSSKSDSSCRWTEVFTDYTDRCLMLLPECTQKVQWMFSPKIHSENIDYLKATKVTCRLQHSADKGQFSEVLDDKAIVIELQWSESLDESRLVVDNYLSNLRLNNELRVVDRSANLQVRTQYDAKALVWEWLEVKIFVTNQEECDVEDLMLSFALQQPVQPNIEQTTQVCASSVLSGDSCSSSISNCPLTQLLKVGETFSHTLYVKSLTANTRCFTLTVRGKLQNNACQCVITESLSITAIIPLSVEVTCDTSSLYGASSNQEVVSAGVPLLILPRISCFAHVPLLLMKSKLVLPPNVEAECDGKGSVVGVSLATNEVALDCFAVRAEPHNNVPQTLLGHYLLHWRRADSEGPAVSTSVPLPSVTVEVWGVNVSVELPVSSILHTPTIITYFLRNVTAKGVHTILSFEHSQQFVFSGPQQTRVRVLSGQTERVELLLYPLACGAVPLPKLSVVLEYSGVTGTTRIPDDVLARSVPAVLYVQPLDQTGTESLKLI